MKFSKKQSTGLFLCVGSPTLFGYPVGVFVDLQIKLKGIQNEVNPKV